MYILEPFTEERHGSFVLRILPDVVPVYRWEIVRRDANGCEERLGTFGGYFSFDEARKDAMAELDAYTKAAE